MTTVYAPLMYLSAFETNFPRQFTDSIKNVSRANFETAWNRVFYLMVKEWDVPRLDNLVVLRRGVFEEDFVGFDASVIGLLFLKFKRLRSSANLPFIVERIKPED